ncbi:MAG TPA: hypothetical protein VJA27_01295 [Patescibacteria group bacterium]|nr:hypothetical protein [Patescibacteria group bacterium]
MNEPRETLQAEHEFNRAKKISDIKPIIFRSYLSLDNRADIKEVVEGPLVRACEALFDKHIATTSTSANGTKSEAWIIIDFDSLSEDNKVVAQRFGTVDQDGRVGKNIVKLTLPLTPESTWGEIEDAALSLVSEFHEQPKPSTEQPTDDEQYKQWMADHPEREIAPGDLRESGPEIAEFEQMINSFESTHSIAELHLIMDLTPEDAPNHPVREPARIALYPIVAKLDILKKKQIFLPKNIRNWKQNIGASQGPLE